jgi:ADP-ribose pyrophosphatase YjhB (NUDIX family)
MSAPVTPAAAPVAAVAGIAFDAGGRVLLVRRARPPGLWSAPGGRIELGETAAEAVVREMAEETGLEVRVIELVVAIDWIERAADGAVRAHYLILDHLVEVAGGALAAGDDAADAGWFGADELDALATTAGLREVIERARGLARTRSQERGLATPPPVR